MEGGLKEKLKEGKQEGDEIYILVPLSLELQGNDDRETERE